MNSYRIYLDTCCWNRPHDDLTIKRNRDEYDAIMKIIFMAQRYGFTVFGSRALEKEIDQMTDEARREKVFGMYRKTVTHNAPYKKAAFDYVKPLAEAAGMKGLDIHHLAFAVGAGADYLITTDDDFVAFAAGMNVPTRVINPLIFTIGGLK